MQEPVPLNLWLPTMLRVAKHAGNSSIPGWVIYCAVASVGLALGGGACARQDAVAEVSLVQEGAPGSLQELYTSHPDC